MALAFAASLLSQAHAGLVPGKSGNCSAVWDTQGAAATAGATANAPYTLSCKDGDPTCDTDGAVNGQCVIKLNACVGEASTGCTPGSITGTLKVAAKKLVGFAPPNPAAAPTCGTTGTLTLSLRRVPKNTSKACVKYASSPKSKAVLTMRAKGFLNKIKVQCVPNGCSGGGGVTPSITCPLREPSTLPYQLNLMVPVADPTTNSNGSDLDNGISGLSHNFPVIGGNVVKYCLSGCDGTTTTQCTGTGTAGGPPGAAATTLNGPDFGAPLPLLTAGVPVCVVSRYQDPQITSTYDLATGQGSGLIKLFSDVYLVQSSQEVCPRCVVPGGGGTLGDKGTCSGTATTPGAPCTVEALDKVTQGAGNQNYTLSTSCIPTQNLKQASLDIELPLTTESVSTPGPLPCKSIGQTSDDACAGACNAGCTGNACVTHDASGNCIDSKGGISQVCCSNNTTLPCFPTANGGAITRQGKRALDGQLGAQVATFCIAPTQSTVINATTGLPGPGAIILPNQVQVLRGH
jgi:hypothetical protein